MRTLTLVAVVAVLGGLIGPTPPADASYGGSPGRVAYVESLQVDDGRYTEIYTMNSDGSDRRRITFDGGRFVRTEYDEEYEGFYNVYTASWAPTWSPDGSTLAFLHHGTGDRVDVRAVDADGSNPRVLFRDWHGTMITWSPDGAMIAYANGSGVWVADSNGSNARLIAEPSLGRWPNVAPYPSAIRRVEWSPDGKRVAFIEDSGEGMVAGWGYLNTIRVDGTDRHPDVCGSGVQSDPAYVPQGYYAETIDWAPDGLTLACGEPRMWEAQVLIAEPDGSNLAPVTQGWGPSWSPDGTEILYLTADTYDGPTELWSYDVASAVAKQIAPSFSGSDLDWQPRQGTFWDDESSVFEADIEWLAAAGITRGCNPPDNDKYCPSSHVTRGQMAAFLVRALDLTDRLDDPFSDDDDSIFEADIEKLAAAGITRGCNPPTNDRFCPDSKVTREQMAAFLVRAIGYVDDGGGDLFVDDDDSIFEGDIDRLGTAGVTKGCNPPTNDMYCPGSVVTRGQMAAFLHRALG